MTKDINTIKKERLFYTKNTLSSTLCYLAILCNVLYFVSIYSSDVGNYYYSMIIGASVVYNLLFLLFSVLCSEGVKGYSKMYSVVISVIGLLQIGRIFYIPMTAHNTVISLAGVETIVMDNSQFNYVVICLALSAVFCIAAGVIGYIKACMLESYKKEFGIG